MKPKLSVSKMWEYFSDQVLLKSTPPISKDSVQYRESKKVFYSAVGSTLIMIREFLGTEDVSEEEGSECLKEMLEEIKEFLTLLLDDRLKAQEGPKKAKESVTYSFPRFRGNAVKKGASWAWQADITLGDQVLSSFESKKTFLSKEAAITDMKDASVDILSEVCKAAGAPMPESFIDLREGVEKSAEEFKKKKH